MKKLSILFFLFLLGCSDSEENSSTNLRKGDEFFNKGEYEIAEYYYDKIPEDSPLFKTVLHRRQEIQKVIDDPTLETHENKKTKGVFITRHSVQINNLSILPLHKLTIVNSSDKNLQFVDLEFVYFDDKGKEVQRLSTMVTANIPKNTQREIDKISPGFVNEKFVRANVILTKSVFY